VTEFYWEVEEIWILRLKIQLILDRQKLYKKIGTIVKRSNLPKNDFKLRTVGRDYGHGQQQESYCITTI
jgi:hypothetical protein